MAPIISSVESTIVYAEDAAKFISDQSSTIVPRLEEGLAQLGYRGKYAVRCGFNEELLEEELHPEVFLFLYTELKCDEAAPNTLADYKSCFYIRTLFSSDFSQ